MIKQAIVTLALLATTRAAVAQPGCPPPVVKVLRNNQEVPGAGAAFAPKVTLLVSSSPECAAKATYRFREAEVTLLRGRRPLLPTKLVRRPEADLTDLMGIAQPGDRIRVFVLYKNLAVVSADGKLSLYPAPKVDDKNELNANLLTDEARGVGFNWVLLQK
ncbi:hypothetical protein [Hymenobacter sp.]|uniref:hypothetical protein n=1 Tax=Hymenobacter sp. TaxID=1898978 RepID=UPI00286AEC78|nr:hypothetical protein [Hymenobacter sp.]